MVHVGKHHNPQTVTNSQSRILNISDYSNTPTLASICTQTLCLTQYVPRQLSSQVPAVHESQFLGI